MELTTETRRVPVQTFKDEKVVKIELTEDEAMHLQSILAHVQTASPLVWGGGERTLFRALRAAVGDYYGTPIARRYEGHISYKG